MSDTLRTTILLSGTGRSVENLFARRDAGSLTGVEFVRVISSRASVRGLTLAESAAVPTAVCARRDHPSVEAHSEALTELVRADSPDLVVMAGFLSMYLLPDDLLGRVINIHPSLLPLFGGKGYYGHHVHEAVIASGMRASGCTVHYVDNEYDNGPVILQRTCPVFPDDDADALAARVFAEECEALPRAMQWIADGDVAWREGQVDFSPRLRW